MNEKILIIGGDKRQQYMKEFISDSYTEVYHIRYSADIYRLRDIESYSHIILPLPVSKDKKTVYSTDDLSLSVDDIIDLIRPCHTVFASGLDNKILDYFEDNNIECYDFMKDKIFKRANAYLTAQGTLRLLFENTQDYIVGKIALIVGFGDVAQTLAEMLKNIGISVYISGRNSRKLSLSLYSGYSTVDMQEITENIGCFDYVFGTVPTNILAEEAIKNLNDNCLYFELASYPFNADKALFEKHSKKYINGSALPGRYLPLASGRLLAEYVLSNL